jgi:hydrogenase maturation factor HypE
MSRCCANGEEVNMFTTVKLDYFEIGVDTETKTLMIACRPNGAEFSNEYSNHYLDEIEVVYLVRELRENFALMRTIQNTTVKFSWRAVTADLWRLTITEKIHWDADYVYTTRELAILVPTQKVNEVFDVLEELK